MVLTFRFVRAQSTTIVSGIRRARFLGTEHRFSVMITNTRVAIVRNAFVRLTDRLHFLDQFRSDRKNRCD